MNCELAWMGFVKSHKRTSTQVETQAVRESGRHPQWRSLDFAADSRSDDLVLVRAVPRADRLEWPLDALAEGREVVAHVLRLRGMCSAANESVTFELPERVRQDLRSNGIDSSEDLRETT
jgi:hypothetical protein